MAALFPRRWLAIAILLAIGVTAMAATEKTGTDPLIDSSRAALAKWVETQQLIAKEKKDWQQGRDLLQSRIDLLKNEIAAMETRLAELQQAASAADSKRSEATGQDQKLKATTAHLAAWAAELEGGIRRLYPRLPEPVQVKLKPLYDRIPDDPDRTTVSVAERFQNVVGILNQASKSNNDILLTTSVRTLSDGRPAEVRTVYVGLGQAYFVSVTGEAGIGRPGADGWQWRNANEIGPSVEQVVEVLQNKAKPKFVSLPVNVK